MDSADLDRRVRIAVYDAAMRGGVPPLAAEVAGTLEAPLDEVRKSFQRLATARVLVLQPGSREILMASPFSAVPTPFHVQAGGVTAYGNCIWDALAIPAMLDADGVIRCSCGDCGEAAEIRVTAGQVAGDGLMHFAIPAKWWWSDIVFT